MLKRAILLTAVGLLGIAAAADDPYLWLEDVEGEMPLEWVRQQNDRTLERLTAHPRYREIHAEALKDLTETDRLPSPQVIGDDVYDLLQDAQHVRGLWRRQPIDDFIAGRDAWEAVLDVDALGEQDDASWVFKGAHCLEPDADRCMLQLSPGGSDASVFREFDLRSKRFVPGGFALPEIKANLAWLDRDTLLLSAPLDADSATTSGYGRKVVRWKRGKDPAAGAVVFEVPREHVWAMPTTVYDGNRVYAFVADAPTLFMPVYHMLSRSSRPIRLPLPEGLMLAGVVDGHFYGVINAPLDVSGNTIPAGSLVAFDLGAMEKSAAAVAPRVLFTPTDSQSVSTLLGFGTTTVGKDVYFSITDDVVGKLMRAERGEGGWRARQVPLPDNGAVTVLAGHAGAGVAIVKYENPITAPTLYAVERRDKPEPIVSLAPKFDPSGFETVQYFAKSRDGTQVPYFITRSKDIELDGQNPTLIGAYGGFGLTIKPVYMSFFATGAPFKTMLEQGGVYVTANIRGGSEYGPAWHKAGMLANRQHVYEDFYAVAEDLIRRGYTSPERLGITGASNSGLLVGVAMTQRPELYSAVLCGVPLLDMRRYHRLLAGASWIGEYGNPDDPEDWAVIESYSPYHNLRADFEYPEVFFYGSTKDDRVHPGHMRKMAAKMAGQGHAFLYFEETEGGHGTADLNQKAGLEALQAVYLLEKLW